MKRLLFRLSILIIVLTGLIQASFAYISLPKVFAVYKEGKVSLYKANTAKPFKMINGEYPSFSPDDRYLAYYKTENYFNKTLLIYDVKDNTTKILADNGQFIYRPVWFNTGKSLLFVNNKNKDELYKIDNLNSRPVFITSAIQIKAGGIFEPSFIEKSQEIVFHDIFNLYRISLSGKLISKTPINKITGKFNSVSSNDRFEFNPVNNNIVAFTQSVPGTKKFDDEYQEPNSALFVYDFKTSKRKRLTAKNILASFPVWSKDGKYIYFSGYYDTNRETNPFRIFMIKPDGTDLTQIMRGSEITF